MTEGWWMFLMGGVFTVIILVVTALVALVAYRVAVRRGLLRVSVVVEAAPPRQMGVL